MNSFSGLSQVRPVAFQSMSSFWHWLYVTPVELFIKGTVALRASWRLQLHLSRISLTPGSRHQCSGVKPWNTIPTYTKENGMETKQNMETIRIWHRPNLPASSKMSSKVVMVTVQPVEDLKAFAAVKRDLLNWGTVFTHSWRSKSPEDVEIWYFFCAAIDQLHAGMGHGGQQVTF